MMTKALFSEDAYLSICEAKLVAVGVNGGLLFDQTCFYGNSGGQPGDIGFVERADGSQIMIESAVYNDNKSDICHLQSTNPISIGGQSISGPSTPITEHEIGQTFVLHIDWPRRYKLMRMHSACHLLTAICPHPVTGAHISEQESRLDFNMSEAADRIELTDQMAKLIAQNHPIFSKMITTEELSDKPSLIKSKHLRPQSSIGIVRLVCIGENSSIDSQPCGGTHVLETQEIGNIEIAKIEKKGRHNHRFRLRFATA